jgi:multiple sugar transport system substrate-binding protein
VKNKYPNVTLQLLREGGEIKRENLIAANQFPDLIFSSSLSLRGFLDLSLAEDLNGLVKKHKFDLNLFEPRAIEAIKDYGEKGELYAIPFSLNFGATYYNKTIFDQAGMPYPKDGVTWEDLLDTARALAGKKPDVRTLGTSGLNRDAKSLLLPFVDPKTMKASINTEGWKWLLQFSKDLQSIPDNKSARGGRDGFVKDQHLAMYTSYGARPGEIEEEHKNGGTLDWDLTTFPVRKSGGTAGMETEAHALMIASSSKRKDAAFKVIELVSSNDEVQMMVSKAARVSSLKNEKYKQVFGSDLKSLQGKNVQAIFKNKYGRNPVPTRYDSLVEKETTAALNAFIAGTDLNTALREAEERANKAIEAAKQAGN